MSEIMKEEMENSPKESPSKEPTPANEKTEKSPQKDDPGSEIFISMSETNEKIEDPLKEASSEEHTPADENTEKTPEKDNPGFELLMCMSEGDSPKEASSTEPTPADEKTEETSEKYNPDEDIEDPLKEASSKEPTPADENTEKNHEKDNPGPENLLECTESSMEILNEVKEDLLLKTCAKDAEKACTEVSVSSLENLSDSETELANEKTEKRSSDSDRPFPGVIPISKVRRILPPAENTMGTFSREFPRIVPKRQTVIEVIQIDDSDDDDD